MLNKVIEWYNGNSLRKFPIQERSNIVSTDGVEIPNDLIVDGIYHANSKEISISSISIKDRILTIKLSDNSVCEQSIPLYSVHSRSDILNECGVPKGFFIFGKGIEFADSFFSEEESLFENCLLEYSVVHVINDSVTSIGIQGENALTGDVEIKLDLGLKSEEESGTVTLSAINDFTACDDPAKVPIKTINGITPDVNQNIFLGVGGIMSIEAANNGIVVSTVLKQGEQCVKILDPGKDGSDGIKGPPGDDGPRGDCRRVKAICCECEVCDTVEACLTCEVCNTCEQCNTAEVCGTCEANDTITSPPPIPDPPITAPTCPPCVQIFFGLGTDPSDITNPAIIKANPPPCTFSQVLGGDLGSPEPAQRFELIHTGTKWELTVTDVASGSVDAEAERTGGIPDIAGDYSFTSNPKGFPEVSILPVNPCPPEECITTGTQPPTGAFCIDCLEVSVFAGGVAVLQFRMKTSTPTSSGTCLYSFDSSITPGMTFGGASLGPGTFPEPSYTVTFSGSIDSSGDPFFFFGNKFAEHFVQPDDKEYTGCYQTFASGSFAGTPIDYVVIEEGTGCA